MDGSSLITEGFEYSAESFSTAGEKTVQISIDDMTCPLTVNVREAQQDAVSPTFFLSDAEAIQGDTLTLDLAVENNPGLISAQVQINFDEDRFELTSVEDCGLMSGFSHRENSNIMYWVVDDVNVNNTENGVLAHLIFRVKDDCAAGEYSVGLDMSAENVLNADMEQVDFDTADGTIRVRAVIFGDLNGDARRNFVDVSLLKKHLVNRGGFPIDERAADVYDDGDINAKDVAVLRRHIDQWPGYELSGGKYSPVASLSNTLAPMGGISLLDDAGEPCIRLSSTGGVPGDKVQVKLVIENNPGINGAYLDVSYDRDKLRLTSVRDSGLLNGFVAQEEANLLLVPYTIAWDDSLGGDNVQNGEIATLSFEILADCPEGDVPVSISYRRGNITNAKLENVSFETADGLVRVASESGTGAEDESLRFVAFYSQGRLVSIFEGQYDSASGMIGNKSAPPDKSFDDFKAFSLDPESFIPLSEAGGLTPRP